MNDIYTVSCPCPYDGAHDLRWPPYYTCDNNMQSRWICNEIYQVVRQKCMLFHVLQVSSRHKIENFYSAYSCNILGGKNIYLRCLYGKNAIMVIFLFWISSNTWNFPRLFENAWNFQNNNHYCEKLSSTRIVPILLFLKV